MTTPTTHDVLVVGAGPAGLTAAVALARHGVDVLVVDRHAGTSPFPKATGVSTRTMELLRSWGLERRARAGEMRVRPVISISDTLAGPELATETFNYPTAAEALAVSPTCPGYLPQDHLEPVLLDHLRERGGTVRFHTELAGLQVTPHGVRAELADRRSGHRRTARARYVIGADGPRSTVRTTLGIEYRDLGVIGDFVAAVFHADISRRLPRTPGALNPVQTPAAPGLFVPTGHDRWIYAWSAGPGADPTPDRVLELLRAGSGLPDLAPRIESVLPFTMAGQVASALRTGRAFLVGDAAHRATPMGGVGMNTAIHAAHNLGWKLAWVLRGWAGEALLDSYQAERLPVGEATVRRSLDVEAGSRVDGLCRDIGIRYRSEVLDEDAGERAPHAWLRHRGTRISTLDLFDGRLTVLTGPGGAPWREAAARLAATGLVTTGPAAGRSDRGGPPIAVLSVGTDPAAEDGAFARRYGLGTAGAALVRPDGFVAWRHAGTAAHPATALAAAVDRALGWAATAAPVPLAGPCRSGRPPRPSRPAPRWCRPAA